MSFRLIACLAVLLVSYAQADNVGCRVVRVSDGDTISCLSADDLLYRVRLAEIDAPESKQAFGNVSKKNLSDMVFGRDVMIDITGQDRRYHRVVAYVFVDGIDVNFVQVKSGMAWVYTQYAKTPRYFETEKEARKTKIGLWKDPYPVAPWLFRRGQQDHE